VTYCCLRASLSPKGAYANLGLMAGDDSIQRNLEPVRSIKVAKQWGFTLKFEMRRHGESVDFLSRHYAPEVWSGATDNICSVLRTLSKFHVSPLTGSVPRDAIAYMKARALFCNDFRTVLVGQWALKIMEQTAATYHVWIRKAKKGSVERMNHSLPWNYTWVQAQESAEASSYQAVTDDAPLSDDWQHAILEKEFDAERIQDFITYLEDPTTPWDEPPTLKTAPPKQREMPYLLNDDLIPAKQAPSPRKYDPKPRDVRPRLRECPRDSCRNAMPCRKHARPEKKETPCPVAEPLTIQSIGPKMPSPASSPEWPPQDCEPKRRRKVRCARGDNVSGFYSGLEPCHQQVEAGTNRFCYDCHAIYLTAMKPLSMDHDQSAKTPGKESKPPQKPAKSSGRPQGLRGGRVRRPGR